jgi:hypothetical protein
MSQVSSIAAVLVDERYDIDKMSVIVAAITETLFYQRRQMTMLHLTMRLAAFMWQR